MKKLNIISLNLLMVFVISCQNEIVKTEEPLIEEKIPQPFDTLAYLERHNTDDKIYKGTVSYLEIIENLNFIEYHISGNEPYLIENYFTKFDSVFSVVHSDTLFIFHSFFMKGREGNEEFGYLEKNGTNMILQTPWLDSGMVEVIDEDTIIHGTIGCDCAGAVEQKYKIPLSKLKNVEHLYFRGEEIEFE